MLIRLKESGEPKPKAVAANVNTHSAKEVYDYFGPESDRLLGRFGKS